MQFKTVFSLFQTLGMYSGAKKTAQEEQIPTSENILNFDYIHEVIDFKGLGDYDFYFHANSYRYTHLP